MLKSIPVVVTTDSSSPADMAYCYDLGVECFFTKDLWFSDLIEIIKANAD